MEMIVLNNPEFYNKVINDTREPKMVIYKSEPAFYAKAINDARKLGFPNPGTSRTYENTIPISKFTDGKVIASGDIRTIKYVIQS